MEEVDRNQYIKKTKGIISLEELSRNLGSFKNLKVLVIGDSIIDNYVFVWPKGRAVKDPILSTEFILEEKYAGGVLAAANHLCSYVNKINLVTLIGDQNSQLEFIKNSLPENVELKAFVKENSPTTIKKRYIDYHRKNKLFKVEYINDKPISEILSNEIVNYLSTELPKYDLVITTDFGHGFIDNRIRDVLEEKSNFLSIDVQSNSANMGYNYINYYKKPDFIVMNEEELRLPLMMRFEEIDEVIDKFHEKFKYKKFLVTRSKNGCIFFNQGKKYNAPALTDNIVDTVGAGDAVFAITSLFTYLNSKNEIIPFVANSAGGLEANIMGNKEFITKKKLLNFIKEIYNGME